jgi:hypothetical protein
MSSSLLLLSILFLHIPTGGEEVIQEIGFLQSIWLFQGHHSNLMGNVTQPTTTNLCAAGSIPFHLLGCNRISECVQQEKYRKNLPVETISPDLHQPKVTQGKNILLIL